MHRGMTFKQVLDNPEGRALVDAIEDTIVSLRGQESEPVLQDVLRSQIDDLEAKTGYRYEAC
ncbi:hypothetical protein [Marinobacter salicampi]|uniref:hypothetical protein n=1 Tax=Marinobacter salicampi TaxID=435907 RepID=UPI00140D8856|nr:hypothetical protein [Marinobacter salicampi]